MTARLLGRWPDRSPEWYAARAGRIGGSDIGVVMGWYLTDPLGRPLKTREQLLDEKVNNPGPPDRKPSKATDRGTYCEPAIAAWLADSAGLTYDDAWTGTWVDDHDDRWMYNPDAVTSDGRLVEFKTTEVRDASHGWGRARSDQVPLPYAAQVQWGMGILGLTECLVGVLAGSPKFEFARYRVRFDPDVFAYLRANAEAFMAQVEATKQKADRS